MRKVLGLCTIFFITACSGQSEEKEFEPISKNEIATWESFQKIPLASQLELTKKDEPGEKLILCIQFIDKTRKTALEDQKVLLYHTGNDGAYSPEVAGDEKTARIRGIGFTDEDGRLYVETILPGSYATRGDGRHIHMHVFGAQIEAYDIHFNQYTSARMKRFIEERFQFSLADLKYTTNKQLIGFVTIEVKNPK